MAPAILIATLLRGASRSGVDTHVAAVQQVLGAEVVTPVSFRRALAYPVFGVRRLVGSNTGIGTWWYRYWHSRFLRAALARKLARQRPDVVYAQCPSSALAALRARTGAEPPVVLAVHFNVSEADEWAAKGALKAGGRLYRSILAEEQAALSTVDGIVYPSRFMRDVVARRLPDRPPSIVVPHFLPSDDASMSGLDPMGDLVSVGEQEPRKNHTYLVRILAAAKGQGARYTLSLVGDGPERGRLERLAADLDVKEQVRFLGVRDDARDVIARHRVLVHTALRENLPVALIEALAAGVPVVAGAVGGIPEIVTDGREGRFWPLDDEEAAAAMLAEVLNDQAGYARMASAARHTYDTRFNRAVLAANLETFLAGVAASPRTARQER